MVLFCPVKKAPVVYKICASDIPCMLPRTELNSANRTYRELTSTGYKEGYAKNERGDLNKE